MHYCSTSYDIVIVNSQKEGYHFISLHFTLASICFAALFMPDTKSIIPIVSFIFISLLCFLSGFSEPAYKLTIPVSSRCKSIICVLICCYPFSELYRIFSEDINGIRSVRLTLWLHWTRWWLTKWRNAIRKWRFWMNGHSRAFLLPESLLFISRIWRCIKRCSWSCIWDWWGCRRYICWGKIKKSYM